MLRRARKRSTTSKATTRRKVYNFQRTNELWVKGSKEIKEFRESIMPLSIELEGLPFGDSGMAQVCLDHDHKTGLCRGNLRADVNLYLGRLELYHRKLFGKTDIELIDLLKYIIDYLENSKNVPPKLHWGVVEDEVRRIKRWKNETIHSKLVNKGLDLLDVKEYTNHQLVELHINQFIKEKEGE